MRETGVAIESTAADGTSSSLDHATAGAADATSDPPAPGRDLDGTSQTPPFTVNSCVGRLLEIRVWQLRCVDDLQSLTKGLWKVARKLASHSVIFADYRYARPFPQDVADVWSGCMRRFNKSVAVSAILLDPSNETFNLQLERVVRCACNPSRRVFYDVRELRDWLAHASTGAELARLDGLLGDAP